MLGSKAIANQSINISSFRKASSSSLKRRHALKGKSVLRSPDVRRMTANAALYDLAASGDILDTLFVSGISLSIALNIGVSAIPLLVGAQDAKKLKQAVEDDTEDIKWGVMSLLSFFPLLNWLVSQAVHKLCNDCMPFIHACLSFRHVSGKHQKHPFLMSAIQCGLSIAPTTRCFTLTPGMLEALDKGSRLSS